MLGAWRPQGVALFCVLFLFSATAKASPSLVVDGAVVSTGGCFAAEAVVYAADTPWDSVLVVSPGGRIPPEALSVLGQTAAQAGSVVFIVRYIQDVAAIPLGNNRRRAARIAEVVRDRIDDLRNLPSVLGGTALAGLPIYGLGHSLGGAALGANGPEREGLFAGIVLFGASSLLSEPSAVVTPVDLVVGTLDGVVDRAQLPNLEILFQNTVVPVEDVNHFCIVDGEVGDPDFRARDNPTALTQAQCVKRVLATSRDLWQLP